LQQLPLLLAVQKRTLRNAFGRSLRRSDKDELRKIFVSIVVNPVILIRIAQPKKLKAVMGLNQWQQLLLEILRDPSND
jgi:hypothetical protein